MPNFKSQLGAACLLLWALGSLPPAAATTLMTLSVDELIDQAELVFEGKVLAVQAVEDSAGQISSYVTFAVLELIKGDYSGESLELKFLGGTANGHTMEVSGLRRPELHETGIYFVESLSEELINPLLGWSQGHYLVQSDSDGVARVTTAGNQPVMAVQAMQQVPALLRKPADTVEGEIDAAQGIVTDDDRDMHEALTVEQFKSRIRTLGGNPLP